MINNSFSIIFIGKLLQIFVMLITIKVTTYYLSPKELGNLYIIITISSLVMLSFFNPIGMYLHRNLNLWKIKKILFDRIISFTFVVLILAIIYIFIIYLYLIFIAKKNGFSTEEVILIIFNYSIVVFLNPFITYVLNMLNFRLSFTILTVLTALGSLIFGYIFIKLFGDSAQNWLFGILLSNFIFMIVGFILLKNRLNEPFHMLLNDFKRITKKKLKTILTFVIPLSVATFFMWLQNSGYRILIEQNIGLEFLGLLGIGMAISSQIASVVESIATQYFYPIYYQQITNTTLENRKKAIDELINKVLPIYFMLAVFLTFSARYVVEILVDKKYYDTYIFTIFGIWIEFFRMTTNLFGNISQSEMNTKKIMMPYIIGSLITILFVYISSINTEYKLYLPTALVIGGLFTLTTMYVSMKKLINFYINYKLIVSSLIISIPYISIYFFTFETNIYVNLVVVISFGLYFLGTIYFIYKKGLNYDYY